MSDPVIALHKAIKIFGTQKALAREIGISNMVLNRWLNTGTRVPFHHAIAIEIATEGQVSAFDLAPHVEFRRKGRRVGVKFLIEELVARQTAKR